MEDEIRIVLEISIKMEALDIIEILSIIFEYVAFDYSTKSLNRNCCNSEVTGQIVNLPSLFVLGSVNRTWRYVACSSYFWRILSIQNTIYPLIDICRRYSFSYNFLHLLTKDLTRAARCKEMYFDYNEFPLISASGSTPSVVLKTNVDKWADVQCIGYSINNVLKSKSLINSIPLRDSLQCLGIKISSPYLVQLWDIIRHSMTQTRISGNISHHFSLLLFTIVIDEELVQDLNVVFNEILEIFIKGYPWKEMSIGFCNNLVSYQLPSVSIQLIEIFTNFIQKSFEHPGRLRKLKLHLSCLIENYKPLILNIPSNIEFEYY